MPWAVESQHFGDQLCVGMLWQHIRCECHVPNKTISKTRWLFECFQFVFFYKSSNPAPPPRKKNAHLQNRRFPRWDQIGVYSMFFFSCHDETMWFRVARTKMVWCDASKVEPWRLREVPTVRSSWRPHGWLYDMRNDERNFWGDRFVMQGSCLVVFFLIITVSLGLVGSQIVGRFLRRWLLVND